MLKRVMAQAIAQGSKPPGLEKRPPAPNETASPKLLGGADPADEGPENESPHDGLGASRVLAFVGEQFEEHDGQYCLIITR